MERYKERDRKSTFSGTGPHLVNGEKLKNPKNMANAFNNFCVTVTEKLNIQQIEKGDAVSILKSIHFLETYPV
jgi:hypothetical protein